MEKALIVVTTRSEPRIKEIIELASTAGYISALVSYSGPIKSKYFIGKGKVKQVARKIGDEDASTVIFENYLKSSHVFNLERAFGVAVMDKFDLILNVFEKHARNREAKLQIELARLKRKLPYIKLLTGRRVRADHPGFGSSGEYIINSTIASLNKRIKAIEKKLEKFQERSLNQAKRRREKFPVIAMVGYTNAGKTTLLNLLTQEEKRAKDELFTTLQSKTAGLKLPDGKKILILDTIGFIRNLHYGLVHAFRATLGDVKNSDLILIVLDSSEKTGEFFKKKKICEKTLLRIGADKIPKFYVINKIDEADDLLEKTKHFEDFVPVSALKAIGTYELLEKMEKVLEIKNESRSG